MSTQRRRHGALRDEVLGLLLHSPTPMTGRQLVEALAVPGATPPVLTTVLTVLDRLHRAGEVDREKSASGELVFAPARHDAQLVADDMLDALLRSKDRTGALLSFAGSLSADDLAVLSKLVGKRP